MKTAPPIIGKLDLFGLTRNIILVEHDEDDCGIALLSKAINDKVNIIFRENLSISLVGLPNTVVVEADSIAKIYQIMKSLTTVDTIIIDRVDTMDMRFNKRVRGSQVASHISMMCAPRILRDANVIITSANMEYRLREIADKFYDLRK